jgi:glutathione peroxidase
MLLNFIKMFGLSLMLMTSPINAASNFEFENIDGGVLNLQEFRGSPILIVNTASRCGFTNQYEGLQNLHEKYSDQGLVVISVPSNDFNQELRTDAAVQDFCEINYNISLPMTTITSVKGGKAHPFFQWMRKEYGFIPRWNFYKILLDTEGNLVETYTSITKPTSSKITSKIEKLLQRDG